MKILMVSQHYWPESFINTDICETLVELGHEVTVLTGLPNYPDGIVPTEYRLRKNRQQVRNGVRIIRVPLVARGRSLKGLGKIRRAANYASFWFYGSLRARKLPPDFDVVIACQTSPVTMAGPAVAYSKRSGARLLLYCCDLSPADLLVGGVSVSSLIYRLYLSCSREIYRAADVIAISSPMFVGYLSEVVGVDARRVVPLPQFAEDIFTSEADISVLNAATRALFDPDRVHFMFAGNVGNFQAVETIILAAVALRDDPRVCFHIVGSGSRLEACIAIAAENHVDNVVFHDRRPLEMMPAYYACADAMLMTLREDPADPVVSYTLPRKTQTYLAAGKPIIAATSGAVARVIDDVGCGYVCPAEQPAQLAALCARFASASYEERHAMATKAKAHYEEHFTKGKFFDAIVGLLVGLQRSRG